MDVVQFREMKCITLMDIIVANLGFMLLFVLCGAGLF